MDESIMTLESITGLERQLTPEQVKKARIQALRQTKQKDFVDSGICYHVGSLLSAYRESLRDVYYEDLKRSQK